MTGGDSTSGHRGPRILAHRGASLRERENTVEAFRMAGALGADGVELDVRRTADAVLVVHHDAEVDGLGRLCESTMADLRRSAPWIPTFEEALEACTGVVNVEIKNSPREPDHDPAEGVASTVARVLSEMSASGTALEFVVSSFNPRTIARVRDEAPNLATGWLIVPGVDPRDALAFVVAEGHRALHPPVWAFTDDGADPGLLEELVAVAHAQEIELNVWTVDEPSVMLALAHAGVDAVITNVPDVAVETLRS
jgi:glycerophosphoryl diester phosphodiesterase